MEFRDSRRRSARLGRMRQEGFAPEKRLVERKELLVCSACWSEDVEWSGCRACGSEDLEMMPDGAG